MFRSLIFQPFGENAILIAWPQKIDHEIRSDIEAFEQKIQQHMLDIVEETVAAYCSLTVYVKTELFLADVIEKLRVLYHQKSDLIKENKSRWYIPVCYDLTFALDLTALAKVKHCDVQTLIELHTAPEYTVDFLGFLPGFAYLNGLDDSLHVPRLAKPRALVKKGSVAIGGQQTGIYPIDSPGGWHVIGRTPVSLFDPHNPCPCLIRALDKIRFYAVSLDDYHVIKNDRHFVCEQQVLP